MNIVDIISENNSGRDFIPKEFLPPGKDEYYIRNEQISKPENYWRDLNPDEIETLIQNRNVCDNWNNVLVADKFEPDRILNNEFSGLVRIGRLENKILEYHDLQLPAGITNSRIISCDIGDNSAIHNVRYLAHYIIGKGSILFNIDEMHTTNHSKFGNGIIKEGEEEKYRVWIDVMNEAGGRGILPFDGMIPADAYIWAKYRDDRELLNKLKEITQSGFDSRRGCYGMAGDYSVIKSCRIIKDVKIGNCCYIKGANKLKNLTINSTEDEPTQIGEGVELVNGIIGRGCRIFYGCKAVRFIICNNSTLKYGARLIHTVLGENSTVSCCEILNNLIFPLHEQHHNNSFLISAVLMGQSNLAAGATIGSNHNSRSNDGEIEAGRGFWPGLCATLKHSSKFASFTLIQKGNYQSELNIPLPFSLVSDDQTDGRLLVMPAYWWMYNMYALARNSWKFRERDARIIKTQNIEFDFLAPDTVEEIFQAISLLEIWTAKAYLKKHKKAELSTPDLINLGKKLLSEAEDKTADLEVLGENMEYSGRNVIILKTRQAYQSYRQMLHYYAIKNLINYMETDQSANLETMNKVLKVERVKKWVNAGGQLIPENQLNELFSGIKKAKFKSWDEIHSVYFELWKNYPLEKQRHAYNVLLDLYETSELSGDLWNFALDKAVEIQEIILDNVYKSRKKDFDNSFKQATFKNAREMEAVISKIEENSFIKEMQIQTAAFKKSIKRIRKR